MCMDMLPSAEVVAALDDARQHSRVSPEALAQQGSDSVRDSGHHCNVFATLKHAQQGKPCPARKPVVALGLAELLAC